MAANFNVILEAFEFVRFGLKGRHRTLFDQETLTVYYPMEFSGRERITRRDQRRKVHRNRLNQRSCSRITIIAKRRLVYDWYVLKLIF